MRSPDLIKRHVVQCDWRCKHCSQIFGSERINHYGTDLPDLIKPTWFFASMSLLDHLRDCMKKDFSDELRQQFNDDFLNHPAIYDWYNQHALIERHFLALEDLES